MLMDRLYHWASNGWEKLHPVCGGGGGRRRTSRSRSSSVLNPERVARLDPLVRRAIVNELAREVTTEPLQPQGHDDESQDDHNDNSEHLAASSSSSSWKELQMELAEARQRWNETQSKEQFLGMRCYKYQQKLNEQQRRLQEEHDTLFGRVQLSDDDDDEEDDDENDTGIQRNLAGSGTGELSHDDDVEALAADRVAWERRQAQWEHDSALLQQIQQTHRTILIECERMRRKLRDLEQKQETYQQWRNDVQVLVQHEQQEQQQQQEQQELLFTTEAGDGDDKDEDSLGQPETELSSLRGPDGTRPIQATVESSQNHSDGPVIPVV